MKAESGKLHHICTAALTAKKNNILGVMLCDPFSVKFSQCNINSLYIFFLEDGCFLSADPQFTSKPPPLSNSVVSAS